MMLGFQKSRETREGSDYIFPHKEKVAFLPPLVLSYLTGKMGNDAGSVLTGLRF